MADLIKIVQGDTRPALIVTLTDKLADNNPINLTGATVRMKFRAYEDSTLIDTLVGLVVDGLGGMVKFDWNPETLADIADGLYIGEIEVTFEDGSIQTAFDFLRFQARSQL